MPAPPLPLIHKFDLGHRGLLQAVPDPQLHPLPLLACHVEFAANHHANSHHCKPRPETQATSCSPITLTLHNRPSSPPASALLIIFSMQILQPSWAVSRRPFLRMRTNTCCQIGRLWSWAVQGRWAKRICSLGKLTGPTSGIAPAISCQACARCNHPVCSVQFVRATVIQAVDLVS